MKTEIINIKADQQGLEEEMKNTMAQLHSSQLECQILKNEGEIEGADMIRKKMVLVLFFKRENDIL